MIPYEELVAALDHYIARGRAPLAQSERAAPIAVAPSPSGRSAAPAHVSPSPSRPQPAPLPQEVDLGNYDEAHDPDLPPLAAGQHDEDSTHVGAMPTTKPRHEDNSNEIDIGDVLADDEI